MAGKLYLCATPIGNLDDITFRVLNTLKEVDLIAAEDTRHSIKLLNHFDIKTPMTSYHEFNKIEKAEYLVGKLQEGLNIALITDAGTPGISDPGEELVKQAYQAKACWIMKPETFLAAKLLKDGNDRYLMQDDITGEFPYRLLGKPVFLSDNMPAIASGAAPVLYGDMKGLGVKISANLECQILNEAFATKNAIGVIAWMEVDSKVIDHQRMAVLKMA